MATATVATLLTLAIGITLIVILAWQWLAALLDKFNNKTGGQ